MNYTSYLEILGASGVAVCFFTYTSFENPWRLTWTPQKWCFPVGIPENWWETIKIPFMGWPIFVVGKVVNCLPVAKKNSPKMPRSEEIASKMLVFPGERPYFCSWACRHQGWHLLLWFPLSTADAARVSWAAKIDGIQGAYTPKCHLAQPMANLETLGNYIHLVKLERPHTTDFPQKVAKVSGNGTPYFREF